MSRVCRRVGVFLIALAAPAAVAAPSASAETGAAAWLRYAPVDPAIARRARYAALPAGVETLGDSPALQAARAELIRGVRGMLGRTLRIEGAHAPGAAPAEAIVLGTLAAIGAAAPSLGWARDAGLAASLGAEGYLLKASTVSGRACLFVAATSARGVLYGVFALLRKLALGQPVAALDERESPWAPVRMLNHWDNLDGSIERGYAGGSIFFDNGGVTADLERVRDYARLMASVGINACSINNVNADPRVLGPDFLPQLARVAEALRPYAVKLFVSIDFSSPQKIGGTGTFDPLEPRVAAWWKRTVDGIYRAIPDFGGFVLKADSEGRLGPSAYGRSHADAANVIARALVPHGGLIFYRGFIYDHHMDWRNLKNDRARAAYDNLHPLDGQFDDNVALQIKHGPIDFQVREPPSPIFGGLEKTNQVIELQITQEYTGQQRHLCFLVPMWKQVLDFDLRAKGAQGGATPVKALVAGKTFRRPVGGFVAVSNVGRDRTWLGHHLALANLYGFGRLAWNPELSSARIAEEWTRLTFGNDPRVVAAIVGLELDSWPAYEGYTGPLGAGTLTDIINVHYGPAVESSERNGWGQWHRADAQGIGMDRTIATGTGFIGQYRPPVAARFESLASCPDQLLLFMHHVPYTHRLRSGQTVIQHIYDAHERGAAQSRGFVARWRSLAGRVDEQRFGEVLARLEYQAGHAQVWRDAVDGWFLRTSGIADRRGRVGHPAGRVEAEAMSLQGYAPIEVQPWETASGGRAIACPTSVVGQPCAASFRYGGPGAGATDRAPGGRGWFDLGVQYFDVDSGVARFTLWVAGQRVADWSAGDHLPTDKVDGHSSTRHQVTGVALRAGDEIRIEGLADGGDRAALDYVEITPSGR
jgi:alpha-glucuronidase